MAGRYAGIHPVNVADEPFASVISRETDGWGADIVFEASGNARAFKNLFDLVRPGGVAVIVGLPAEAVAFDVHAAVCKEVRIETVMRYANVFDRALSLFASGKVDLKPLITGTYRFADSVQAFERAASANPTDVKLQIRVSEEDC